LPCRLQKFILTSALRGAVARTSVVVLCLPCLGRFRYSHSYTALSGYRPQSPAKESGCGQTLLLGCFGIRCAVDPGLTPRGYPVQAISLAEVILVTNPRG